MHMKLVSLAKLEPSILDYLLIYTWLDQGGSLPGLPRHPANSKYCDNDNKHLYDLKNVSQNYEINTNYTITF